MIENYGKLYVVATPIGNLADISFRALETLKHVDLIAAEDTRHVRPLLQHYGIVTRVCSLHQQNEQRMLPGLIKQLQDGQSIAVVSDAGTPLINDPGMPLVRAAKTAQIAVVPIPGACAMITALSAAGMALDRFEFEGFPPRTSSARKSFFSSKLDSSSTWVFYESSHRIHECLEDMAAILPVDRIVVIARELTKIHETILKTSLQQALIEVGQNVNMRKGEFVVIVEGAPERNLSQTLSDEALRVLKILLPTCSVKTAASLAAEICGAPKNALYEAALTMKNVSD